MAVALRLILVGGLISQIVNVNLGLEFHQGKLWAMVFGNISNEKNFSK